MGIHLDTENGPEGIYGQVAQWSVNHNTLWCDINAIKWCLMCMLRKDAFCKSVQCDQFDRQLQQCQELHCLRVGQYQVLPLNTH